MVVAREIGGVSMPLNRNETTSEPRRGRAAGAMASFASSKVEMTSYIGRLPSFCG